MNYIFDNFKLDNLKRQIISDIEEKKVAITNWEKVTRLYKKDGKPFVNLKQNFEGCKISGARYDDEALEATVYFHTENRGYRSDTIYLKIYEENARGKGYKVDGRLQGGSYSKYIIANADETENEIKLHIEHLKDSLEEAEKALKNWEKSIETFKQEITKTFEKVENKIGGHYAYYLKQTIS